MYVLKYNIELGFKINFFSNKLHFFKNLIIEETENDEESDKTSFKQLLPKHKIRCWLKIGHSNKKCSTVKVDLHCEHSGTGSCGLLIKYPCVNLV